MTSIKKFKNGCRVVIEQKNCGEKSTILICCNVGSVHENQDTTGFCHLLEHLLLVSDTEEHSYLNIFKTFDGTGSEFNAYTTKTQTFFSITCLTMYLKDFILIFGYIMFASKVGTRSVEKEQNVIYQENLSDTNQSNLAIYEIFEAHMYKNTPYENPIDNAKRKEFTLNYLLRFYKTNYVPGNVMVSIVSDLPSDSVLDFLKQSQFFKMKKMPVPTNIVSRAKVTINPGYYIVSKNTETSTIMIGFFIQVYDRKESGCYLEVIQYYLNRMNGILFNYFRTNRGSAYRFNADIDEEEVGGYFSINVETTPENVKEVLIFCISVFRDLIQNGISEKDLIDVKKYIKETLKMKIDNMEELAEYNIHEIKSVKSTYIVPYSDIYQKYYDHIQTSQISQVIKKHFVSSQLVVSIVGKKNPAHSEVEKICASLA